MKLILGVVSQKGGVGKSTLCRLLACEYARAGWHVKIADMDASQGTSYNWQRRRIEQGLEPQISVEMFKRVGDALKSHEIYDLMIFDGAPHSTQATLQIAQASQAVLLPTGTALDDLEPTIRLAQELYQNHVPKDHIAIVLCRIGNSDVENREARDYIRSSGFGLLDGAIAEKTAYRRASDTGRAASETTHSSINKRARDMVAAVAGYIQEIEKQHKVGEAA